MRSGGRGGSNVPIRTARAGRNHRADEVVMHALAFAAGVLVGVLLSVAVLVALVAASIARMR